MNLTRRKFLKLFSLTILLSLSMPKNLLARAIRIPVLLYHDISDHFRDDYTTSPALFSAQMEWLYSHGYKAISFQEADRIKGRETEKAVIITFDDGHASFLDFVFPLLKEYGFKATVNIIGEYVGTFMRIGGNRPMLSWDEYRYLAGSDLVDLGCHTYNLHLKKGVLAASEEQLENDLKLFQETVRREMGKVAEILAWPYGIYDKKSIEIAKKVGFKYIMTSSEGYLGKDRNLLEIPRLNINNRFDLVSFREYIGERI